MQIDWRTALVYVAREPWLKRRLFIGGLLMFLVPPIGWVLALGYRSLVGNRLVDRLSPLLPSWRENFGVIFARGMASSGVLLGYFTPFLIAYWVLGLRSLDLGVDHIREVLIFAGAVVAFPPLALPALPVAYAGWYYLLNFSRAEVAFLLLLFLGAVAVLPAAFLQVPQHRRFLAAFNLIAALRLIAAVPRLYVEAWIVSLAISAGAVLVMPLAPWLLFWSYLVISHVFLQVLAAAGRILPVHNPTTPVETQPLWPSHRS